ncbi:hypothetical protein NBRC110019_26080 [Neptunitalea chrysea]|uniref:Glycosyl transferase family 1 domain-containing protein n=1 Tax=Neptunitalea chrysea TaxID=1647581 RepID=A0A9W6B7Z9_9FLAO|nr:glycosyltransferase family 4 protein [Neptunitalea chrysea]GLB53567.1 hypothetical protein NBRC110019_26080 [Neptunitalea chrysea]
MVSSASRIIYVLHKKGENSHYTGLVALAEREGMQLKFREFSILGRTIKAIFKCNGAMYVKQWINLFFLVGLLFTKNKKVVLGIAPFDYKLLSVLIFLRGHQVYYHTSWTSWDGSYYPKKKFVGKRVKNKWKQFLEETAEHIFAVSGKTKEELLANYNIKKTSISVVYHTVNSNFFTDFTVEKKANSFIYVGRLLKEKGIISLVTFFEKHPDLSFTIVGSGSEEETVKMFSDKCENINYLGYVSDKDKLAKLYREHTFLVMNSQKTKTWEELFGMAIVEAMACKTIPLATLHSGPKEIVTSGVNGFLIEEDRFILFLESELGTINIPSLQNAAYEIAQLYTEKEIARRWEAILV